MTTDASDTVVSNSVLSTHTTIEVQPGQLLVVPIGATEQHGPHLPLSTDTVIAEAIAKAVCLHINSHPTTNNAVTAPALPYSSSGEHAGFAGTLSIGQAAFEAVVVELVRSATSPGGGPFAAVLLLSGHGGNATSLSRAVRVLTDEGRRVTAWSPHLAGADAHAGRTETSVMLHLAPELVHMDRAEPGNSRPLAELIPALMQSGVAAVSPNGVLGDPTAASAREGRAVFDAFVGAAIAKAEALLGARP